MKNADDFESEIDRLTRELAEAKARALPDGWVAVPVEPTLEMIDVWFSTSTLCPEHLRKKYRAMLSARPDFPPNGLPSKESGNE